MCRTIAFLVDLAVGLILCGRASVFRAESSRSEIQALDLLIERGVGPLPTEEIVAVTQADADSTLAWLKRLSIYHRVTRQKPYTGKYVCSIGPNGPDRRQKTTGSML